jgi:hypothetical protein
MRFTPRERPHAGRQGGAFNRAPKHSKSRYLVFNAGHANTPDVAKVELVAWLKSL